ncbi:MAG: tRNA (N6-threonylcarbamoyladenosine(37)-N6)-methyltransferase TrmO [Verrucomicrobiota bacterium]|nr:tRNA (N6-threonylcarbamoyladenosine(37)-N6)-methyltransferase TrmO [Verrucomicrobiota bacterium]
MRVRQPKGAKTTRGSVEVFEKFSDGLLDLEGVSHLILLYQFHNADGYKLEVMPFLENVIHGVFATRAPKRPNPIGMSIVKLISKTDNVLEIEGLDVLDGTPLIDIKPFVPNFDAQTDVKVGWLEKHNNKVNKHKSDARFLNEKI